MAMTLFRVAGPASGQIPPGEGLVETTGVVSVDGVHPGSRFKAAVVVRLTDDWHVNAHEPTLDYLIPTGLPHTHKPQTPPHTLFDSHAPLHTARPAFAGSCPPRFQYRIRRGDLERVSTA